MRNVVTSPCPGAWLSRHPNAAARATQLLRLCGGALEGLDDALGRMSVSDRTAPQADAEMPSPSDPMEQAERVMQAAQARLAERAKPATLAERQHARTEAHEKQRRALLADAFARAEQDHSETESEDMEGVMEDLEELSRAMARFKELSKQQKEKIEHGNKLVDEVLEKVTTNIPAMNFARKQVEEAVHVLRSTNRAHFRSQIFKACVCLALIYLSMKL
mgnify:CR=1 FL=1